MNALEFDLVVIGGGPAGTSGANGAALFGKHVALVEKTRVIGGAGINTGTIPSKTLRESTLALSGWRSRRPVPARLKQRGNSARASMRIRNAHEAMDGRTGGSLAACRDPLWP